MASLSPGSDTVTRGDKGEGREREKEGRRASRCAVWSVSTG